MTKWRVKNDSSFILVSHSNNSLVSKTDLQNISLTSHPSDIWLLVPITPWKIFTNDSCIVKFNLSSCCSTMIKMWGKVEHSFFYYLALRQLHCFTSPPTSLATYTFLVYSRALNIGMSQDLAFGSPFPLSIHIFWWLNLDSRFSVSSLSWCNHTYSLSLDFSPELQVHAVVYLTCLWISYIHLTFNKYINKLMLSPTSKMLLNISHLSKRTPSF